MGNSRRRALRPYPDPVDNPLLPDTVGHFRDRLAQFTHQIVSAVYMQFVRWPLFANFEQPEKYGLAGMFGSEVIDAVYTVLTRDVAADKTLNLRLNTSDGVGIGAWFIVSDHYYLNTVDRPNVATIGDHIVPTLKEHPTVLFFHGNAANRAIGYRVNHYQAWSRMGANVLVIDYRGFGDSEGVPSEDGIARDARASWNWLVDNGARADDIVVVGHSLGTAVAAQLVKQLQDETNTRPKGLFLQAPFSSLRILIDTYYILGLFPLMKPLDLIPGMQSKTVTFLRLLLDLILCVAVLKYFLALKYDTEAIIGVCPRLSTRSNV
jgi:abhydrolase domain-containing protein 12